MGDDNEIRQLIHLDAEAALVKAEAASRDIRETYNFEEEFAKTAKNKSKVVPAVTILTILVLGLVSWGVTSWIQQINDSAPVDVRSFEDLNLKDLLDSAKRNETDMQKAQADLQQLLYDQKTALDGADRDYAAGLENIKAKATNTATEAQQSAAAKSDWEGKRSQIQAAFAPRIAAKRAEIKAIQDKIDKYDQRLMKQAQEQQAILNNARRASDLEKQKLSSDYEKRIADLQARRQADVAALTKQREDLGVSLTARFNPVFNDTRSASLLSGWKPPAGYGPFMPIPGYLVANGIVPTDEASQLDGSLSNLTYLSAKLRSVPWINSAPVAQSRLESEALGSIGTYRSIIDKTASSLQARDTTIAELSKRAELAEKERDQLNWAISRYALMQRESGFVVDPRLPTAITLAMNPSSPVADGALAYIVRGEKTVATVRLTVADGAVTAALVESAEGESVLPFDSVLIRTDAEASK
jgi:hypothetical protein